MRTSQTVRSLEAPTAQTWAVLKRELLQPRRPKVAIEAMA